ncbi:anti-sigma factor antagonist [Streptomyces sp. NPDC091267]|uniref:anti-sigma factor antagonist n=1 Tax=Streptomyces sp. NPDC091267 TaxID=3155195 RepID=UPI00343250F1
MDTNHRRAEPGSIPGVRQTAWLSGSNPAAARLPGVLPVRCSSARTYVRGTATVVELRGSLDLATAPAVRAHLDAAAAPPGARVVVDLRPADFFDCITLGLLCRARRRTLGSGGCLSVVCTRPWHLRILEATGLGTALRPAPTLEHALTRAARP